MGGEKVHPAHRGVAAVLQKEGEPVRGALHLGHLTVVEGEPVLELCPHLGPHLLAPVQAGLEGLLRLPPVLPVPPGGGLLHLLGGDIQSQHPHVGHLVQNFLGQELAQLLHPPLVGLAKLFFLLLHLKGLPAQCGHLPHQIQVLLLRLLIKCLIKRLRKGCRLGGYLRAAQQEPFLAHLLAPLLGEELHGETSFRWIKDGAYLPFIIQGSPAGRKGEKLRLTGRALCDTIKGTFGYEPSAPSGRAGRF